MDGARFDTWMRVLARGVGRRRLLKGLAAGAVTGSLTRTVQQQGVACTSEPGAACDPMGCCYGLVCDDGICLELGSSQCLTQDPETYECVPSQGQTNCEGRGCKKKKGKKDKKGNKSKKGGKPRR